MESKQRNIKKVTGRAQTTAQNEGNNVSKRVTFEEEKIISSKQKKNENSKSKRQIEIEEYDMSNQVENNREVDFEDEFDDEWEDEEPINEGAIEEERKVEGDKFDGLDEDEMIQKFGEIKFSDAPVIYENPLQGKKKKKEDEIVPFMGTSKNLKEDEVLEFDNSAYDLFHRANTDWPCLSLDIIVPEHNQQQLVRPTKTDVHYPATVYVVAGTQASQASDNAVYYMKWSHLHKTRFDDDSQIFDEEDMDDEEPNFDVLSIKHNAGINRIRSMNNSSIVALWDETGAISIYDGTKHTELLVVYNEEEEEEFANEEETKKKKLKNPKDKKNNNFMLSRFQHSSEGYALQWSSHTLGLFATGSCDRKIHFYTIADENGSSWIMDETPFIVHKESVEDLQFSPNNSNLLASCSVDGTVKFIDFRTEKRNKAEATIQVSNVDVNVISWSHASPNLIASGSEDGTVQVWDIRYLSKARSIADIQFHKEQITSIEFQPYEDSIVTVACADNRISVWDFSVEPDVKSKDEEIPDQLMFIHQGISDVKEIKHHPYMSELILSTAANGFNIFKPNYDEQNYEDEM